ncbi:unnamed protein product [Prunus brigantina]
MVKINEGGHWECSESGDDADGEKKCGNKSDTAVPRPALPWNYDNERLRLLSFTIEVKGVYIYIHTQETIQKTLGQGPLRVTQQIRTRNMLVLVLLLPL